MILKMKKFTKFICVTALMASLLVALPTGVFAKTFKTVVAFGDSLSDHNGLIQYLGAYNPATNPTGALEAWTNDPGGTSTTWTWVEYFAADLGATLDNNSIAGAMTKGHENADVQALSDAGTFPQLGLIGQVNTYVASSPVFNPDDTLFAIWIGGNDLLEFGRGELKTNDGQVLTNPSTMISNAMTNIKIAITALYAKGAKNFLIINLPDIGKTPYYNARSAADIANATTISKTYNYALDDLVGALDTGGSIYYFDIFTYLNEMIANNTFANSTGTYMTLDSSYNETGGVNGPAENYLFWNSIHPTTKAHEYVGDQIASIIAKDVPREDNSNCFISSMAVGF